MASKKISSKAKAVDEEVKVEQPAAEDKAADSVSWLKVSAAQLHNTSKDYLTRVNLGLLDKSKDEAGIQKGYVFMPSNAVKETAKDKEMNADRDPDKKVYHVMIHDGRSYNFYQGFGDDRTMQEMSGADIKAQNNAYRFAVINNSKEKTASAAKDRSAELAAASAAPEAPSKDELAL